MSSSPTKKQKVAPTTTTTAATVDDIPLKYHLKVGGVPEHFNTPWVLALERGLFKEVGVNVEWVECKEGTGAMITALKTGACDIVIALQEGLVADIANGSDIKLLGTMVESQLCWAVSTGIDLSCLISSYFFFLVASFRLFVCDLHALRLSVVVASFF